MADEMDLPAKRTRQENIQKIYHGPLDACNTAKGDTLCGLHNQLEASFDP
jgi:hypothetical protein